jgi:hypothetical protein
LICNAYGVTIALQRGVTMENLTKENRRLARRKWRGEVNSTCLKSLDSLSRHYRFSIALGDLLLLERTWYVTLPGLLRLAARSRCSGIIVHPVRRFCDPAANRWVFRATVYRTSRSKGFVAYADADPVSSHSMVFLHSRLMDNRTCAPASTRPRSMNER